MSRAANSLIVRHCFLVRYGCRTMKEQNDDKRVNTFSFDANEYAFIRGASYYEQFEKGNN